MHEYFIRERATGLFSGHYSVYRTIRLTLSLFFFENSLSFCYNSLSFFKVSYIRFLKMNFWGDFLQKINQKLHIYRNKLVLVETSCVLEYCFFTFLKIGGVLSDPPSDFFRTILKVSLG